MAEFVLGPLVGGLHAHGAKLWARTNGQAMIYAWLGQQPDLSDAHYAGAALLAADTGYAGAVPLEGLTPDTRYYYALTLHEEPPDPAQGPFPSFTTAPPDGTRRAFSFAFGSCFLPRRPQDAAIFTALDRRRQAEDLRFWMLLGDQIYADHWATNGLGRIPQTTEEYRAVYRHIWSTPSLRHLFAHLPAFMIWDDHEVDDDWHWRDHERLEADIPWWDKVMRWLQGRPPQERRLTRQRVHAATQAYWEHQGMHAPPLLLPPEGSEMQRPQILVEDQGHFGYAFTHGPAAFLVLDTRFHRLRTPQQNRLLNPAQWHALEEWLLEVRERFPVKFIVSSISVFSDLWVDFARDRWNGFPDERRRLLHLIAAHRVQGLFFLTGDLHSGHAIRADLTDPQGHPLTLWEFSASPFAQKPNWLSRWTFAPGGLRPLAQVQRAFVVDQPHFGVVRVAFDPQPQVTFAVIDAQDRLLHQVQVPLAPSA